MSSEFENKKLREVIELVIDNRGKNPKEYSFDGIPIIDNYLITSDGEVNLNEVNRFIDESTYNLFLRKYIQFGDVLMTLVGNGYGKVAITPQERCAIIQNTVGFRCNTDNINKFLYYLLKNNREVFMNLNRGAAQPSIKVGDILDQEFQFPSKEAQESISSILGALDDRIALLRETNATLEAIAQALFKSWFVDFEPVHAKARGESPQGMDDTTATLFPDSFEESELGMIPKGWRVGKIEDLMELAYGKALKATDRICGPIPVYGSGGITGYHNKSLVDGSSIIVGRKGTVGSLYWEDRPFFPIDTVFYVRTSKPLTYCYYLLKTLGLEDMNTDGAVPGLNRNNVYRLQFAFPSDDTLLAFDKIVSALRNRIYSNNEQAQTLAQVRDTLLPKLISGQLRLPEAEALLAEELP